MRFSLSYNIRGYLGVSQGVISTSVVPPAPQSNELVGIKHKGQGSIKDSLGKKPATSAAMKTQEAPKRLPFKEVTWTPVGPFP